IAAFARISGVPAVVVAQDRTATRWGARMGPAGYRKARRAIALAGELRLPLVTVIDTPGPAPGREPEEGGLSQELARCLADLLTCPSPTLAVLLGQGAGAGAIALFPADVVAAAQHGWLAPILPEGASAIVYRTAKRAPELARKQALAS